MQKYKIGQKVIYEYNRTDYTNGEPIEEGSILTVKGIAINTVNKVWYKFKENSYIIPHYNLKPASNKIKKL